MDSQGLLDPRVRGGDALAKSSSRAKAPLYTLIALTCCLLVAPTTGSNNADHPYEGNHSQPLPHLTHLSSLSEPVAREITSDASTKAIDATNITTDTEFTRGLTPLRNMPNT